MSEKEKKLSPVFTIIKTIWDNRKFLVVFNGVVLVLSVVVLLLIPNKYKSTALVSIQNPQNAMQQLPSILKDLPLNIGGGLGGGESDVLLYLRLGQSRAVMDALIEKFHLDSLYDTKYREDTYNEITEKLEILDNEDGTISISYLNEDPQLARDIAMEAFNQIKKVDVALKIRQAKRFREFIEQRAAEARKKLSLYEDSLRLYSEKSGLMDLDSQVPLAFQFLAQLESERLETELKRDFVKQNSSSKNYEYLQLNQQLKIYENKIKNLYTKKLYSNLPIDSIPKASMDYLRLFRNVKIQETIIEFLVPQVENANIEEKKNYSSLILIDKPIVAEKKDSPHRSRILILIMFLSGFGSLLYVRMREVYLLNKPQLMTILGRAK